MQARTYIAWKVLGFLGLSSTYVIFMHAHTAPERLFLVFKKEKQARHVLGTLGDRGRKILSSNPA